MSRSRLPSLSRAIAAIAVASGFTIGQGAQAADQKSLIKAVFIYNFARFTDWPADSFAGPGSGIRVCHAEGHPLAAALATIDGKEVGSRAIAVVPFPPTTRPPADCHIAVLTASDMRGPTPVEHGSLTVGDINDFSETGVAIGLIQVGRQVRFRINTTVIERAELRMSSKLLRLATKVVQ
jgi:hypothetical protein